MNVLLIILCLFCLLLPCFIALTVLIISLKNRLDGFKGGQEYQAFQGITDIQNKLAQFLELGRGITELQNILQAPKLRGKCGEIWLEEMLAQILPKARFSTQFKFKSGDTCDAVIFMRDGLLLPIDSKFSLENFRKIFGAIDQKEANNFEKTFYADVKRRIDEISNKYIHPDEGTLGFAFMFIPAENIYYYAFVEDKNENGLWQYAFEKKVIPVSPSSLYPYLEIVLFGLQGLEIEQKAHNLQQGLLALSTDLQQFKDEYRKAQTHLRNAQQNFDKNERRLDIVQSKLSGLSYSNVTDDQSIKESMQQM